MEKVILDFEVVDLDWEGSFHIQYDQEEEKYLLDQIPQELLNKSGLYQIYGRHPVYGNDVLLYIGETKENSTGDRCIRERLKEHLNGRFYNYTNLSVYIAEVTLDSETIQEVESVLIYSHKPALNRQYIESCKICRKRILIRNWGSVGSLNECCTSHWEPESESNNA